MDYLLEFERHLKYASGGVAELTVLNYLSDVRQFIKWLQAKPENATTKTMRQYNEYLLEKRKLSLQSVNRKMASLRSFFDFLVDESNMTSNPMSKIKNFRIEQESEEEREKKVLTLGETTKFLSLLTPKGKIGVRDRAIIYLLYETGLRKDECRRLELDDLSLGLDKVAVRAEIAKWGKPRTVPLVGGETIDALRSYLYEVRPKMAKPDSKALFVSKFGDFISPTSMGEIVSKYANKVDFDKHITPHTLRHSIASHLVNSGVPLPDVQEILGHTRLSTTQIYLHTDKSSMRNHLEEKHPLANFSAGE